MVSGELILAAQVIIFLVCAGLKGRQTLVGGVALLRKITTNKSALKGRHMHNQARNQDVAKEIRSIRMVFIRAGIIKSTISR